MFEEKIHQHDLKVSHIKFEDLIQQQKFNRAINKIEQIKVKKDISVNKTVMEDQYGFTISNKPVNVIENDSITSYTLFVTRDSSSVNIIENLIVQVNQQNETNAFLIKYTSNSDLYMDYDMKNFEGTKSILPIVYNSNSTSPTGKDMY